MALSHNGVIRTPEGPVVAPRLESRMNHQGARVGQGVKSGSLDQDELAQLKTQRSDYRTSLTEAKASDGYVNRQERRELHQELNQMSASIFEFKHN